MLVWFETKHEQSSSESIIYSDHQLHDVDILNEEREHILKGIFDNPEFPENPVITQFELKIDDPLIPAIQSVIEERLG